MNKTLLVADSAAGTPGSLRAQLLALYNLPASATDEKIAQSAAAVQSQNAADKARREQEAADEAEITKKTDAGLSRAQAIAVIKRQRVHDELVASERKTRLPALLKIIGSNKRDLRAARRLAREDFSFLDGGEWAAALETFKNSNLKP
jgi:hypothetical protein